MSIRGTVGSSIESHRAKSSHPDRRIFIPQTGRLPSAAHFSERLPQLRSAVPKASMSVLNGPPPVPIFRAALPIAKALLPTGVKAVPNGPADAPNFSAVFPIAPRVFPNFPATFPNCSPANLICNGLFPSHLCGISKNKVGRVTPCAPFSRNPAPARRGLIPL
jgi:hypothetical protein